MLVCGFWSRATSRCLQFSFEELLHIYRFLNPLSKIGQYYFKTKKQLKSPVTIKIYRAWSTGLQSICSLFIAHINNHTSIYMLVSMISFQIKVASRLLGLATVNMMWIPPRKMYFTCGFWSKLFSSNIPTQQSQEIALQI